jgi:hypothetical protein
MLRLTNAGPVLLVGSEGVRLARETWESAHHLTVPQLLDTSLFGAIARALDQTAFRDRVHRGVGVEQCAESGRAVSLLQFLTNDPRLFGMIHDITGAGPIGSFEGRLYRQTPGGAYGDAWHDDLSRTRTVALSINLSTERYEGGILQIRARSSGRIVAEVANALPGGAVLFCIAPDLEHRITPVTGVVPKTAYAGWFREQPDYRDVIAGRATF